MKLGNYHIAPKNLFFISSCPDSPDIIRFDRGGSNTNETIPLNDRVSDILTIHEHKKNITTPSRMIREKVDKDVILIDTSLDNEEEEEEDDDDDDIQRCRYIIKKKTDKTKTTPHKDAKTKDDLSQLSSFGIDLVLIDKWMKVDDSMQLGDIFSRYNMLYEYLSRRNCPKEIFANY